MRNGLPLIGSAGASDSILAFELEAPWTARLSGSRACDKGLDAAIERIREEAPGVRLIALEPAERRRSARVLWLSRFPMNAGGFARREYDVALPRLAATLESLAFGGEACDGEVDPGPARDILVCTHGARDACCGKFGYSIYREFVRLAGRRRDVRVWRSSHLGGHRFAPTLLDLPSGRSFGRVQERDAATVLAGGAPLLARLDAIYRGRCALPEPVQILERRMWLATGEAFESALLKWQLDAGEAAGPAGELWRVRLEARLADGRSQSIGATVIRAHAEAVRTPASCGRDAEPEAPWRILA